MRRILVVEDEPDIALGLEEDLRRNGYEVQTSNDADTALPRAAGERWNPSCLIGIRPLLDGFEVAANCGVPASRRRSFCSPQKHRRLKRYWALNSARTITSRSRSVRANCVPASAQFCGVLKMSRWVCAALEKLKSISMGPLCAKGNLQLN